VRLHCFWLALCLALLLAPASTLAQAGSDPSMVEQPPPLQQATLANGLRLWIQPRPSSESVAALLVLRAGSRYETEGNNGVSHYVEHMVFTGTRRWNEAEIKNVITRRGGHWNGWTGTETTTYYANVAAEDLDVALDWLSEVVFHPTFPLDKVDKEREVIFQERWGRYGWLINTLDDLGFGYELDRDIHRALFPGSSLGLRIVGEDASLDSLDREGLLDYYRSHYAPANAVLIVVGNVTPERVMELAQKAMGELEPGAATPPAPPPILPQSGPQQVAVRGPWFTDQVTLMLGARTAGRAHPDRWPLAVLAEVLDKELTEEIRYRRGLVYSLSAHNSFYDDTGYFAVSTQSRRGSVDAIRREVESSLDRVRRGEIDPQAVAEAKTALKGRRALAMEDNVGRAAWLAQWVFVLADDEPVPDYQAAIDAVAPQDLARVVNAYFTPQRSFAGVHDPVLTVASGARLAGALLGLGLGAWGLYRLRRSRKRRTAAAASPHPPDVEPAVQT
jgi:predicted Zn-dependent peptidase